MKVVSKRLHDAVQDVPRVVKEHEKKHQTSSSCECQQRQRTNAPPQAQHLRGEHNGTCHPNRANLPALVHIRVIRPLNSAAASVVALPTEITVLECAVEPPQVRKNDLHAKSQRGGKGKRRGCNGHGIDDVAKNSIDNVAQQRKKGRAQRHGHIPPV